MSSNVKVFEDSINEYIDKIVEESLVNSKTYSEAVLFVNKNVSFDELGNMIKKVAHDKIKKIAMNAKIKD